MLVYVATEGSYSDYGIVGVFVNQADAEACPLADDWYAEELREGPMDVRSYHWVSWEIPKPGYIRELFTYSTNREYDGIDKPDVTKGAYGINARGWDKEQAIKIVSDYRAQFLAKREGIA